MAVGTAVCGNNAMLEDGRNGDLILVVDDAVSRDVVADR